MQCQILFSGKNKKNISKCRLLKILPRVLSVKETQLHVTASILTKLTIWSVCLDGMGIQNSVDPDQKRIKVCCH